MEVSTYRSSIFKTIRLTLTGILIANMGKTTRPLRYDLNQTSYDYTVEARNRFKGLDLIDRLPDELWMEVRDIVQETVMKTIPPKINAKRPNGCLKRPYE